LSDNYEAILRTELRSANVKISPSVLIKLSQYCFELTHWNKKINLTSLQGAALVRRLVVEPVWVGERLDMRGVLIDIGSGNGSPAIPLCITRSFDEVVLVEARARRSIFLRHLVAKLGLGGVGVRRGRFEDAGDLQKPDWVTLQGVFPSSNLLTAIKTIRIPTTRVVWITSESGLKIEKARIVEVPFSQTRVVILDPN